MRLKITYLKFHSNLPEANESKCFNQTTHNHVNEFMADTLTLINPDISEYVLNIALGDVIYSISWRRKVS